MAFQPGQSGNPNGLKLRKIVREALTRAVLDEVDAPTHTKLDKIVRAHLNKALEGDVPAIKEIYDRLEGKVPQGIIGGDEDDNPIRLAVSRIELVAPSLLNDDSKD